MARVRALLRGLIAGCGGGQGGRGAAENPGAVAGAEPLVYVGTAAGDVVGFGVELGSGQLSARGVTPVGRPVQALAADPGGRRLYAATAGGQATAVAGRAPTGALAPVRRGSARAAS